MFNVATIADVQCCRHSMLQSDVKSCNRARDAFKTPFTTKTGQLRTQNYVYEYISDIHNLATIVLLSLQLFKVLLFLVKFKTLGLMVELGLAPNYLQRPCLVNDRSFFQNAVLSKSY